MAQSKVESRRVTVSVRPGHAWHRARSTEHGAMEMIVPLDSVFVIHIRLIRSSPHLYKIPNLITARGHVVSDESE